LPIFLYKKKEPRQKEMAAAAMKKQSEGEKTFGLMKERKKKKSLFPLF